MGSAGPPAACRAVERTAVTRLQTCVRATFSCEHGLDWRSLLLFTMLNGLVLLNAVCHDPTINYDGLAHSRYVAALAELRLPTPRDTYEFFSPPLPYLWPAALLGLTPMDLWLSVKCAQLLNVLLSVVLTFFVLRICMLTRPDSVHLRRGALALIAMLPVYYRSFSLLRGEPFVATLAVLSAHQALLVFVHGRTHVRHAVIFGVLLGLLALARQWGVFCLLGLVAFAAFSILREPGKLRASAMSLGLALLLAAILSGWFYLRLYAGDAYPAAFNRDSAPRLALANQPKHFYVGLGLRELFSEPMNGAFRNQLWPTLYADTWGDYWCYFLVYARDTRTGHLVSGVLMEAVGKMKSVPEWLETNRFTIGPYLGRVNAVSLLPTALLLAGLVYGLWRTSVSLRTRALDPQAAVILLSCLTVACSLAGYLWFLVKYPSPGGSGDTIKATYLLHVFPFLAVLAAELLADVRERWPRAHRVAWVMLALVMCHNLGVLVTRFRGW